MTKHKRFLKIEGARPDGPDETSPAHAGARFTAIEPPREAAAPAALDPFAPPPERGLPLEVAVDDRLPGVDRAKADRMARAKAALADAQEHAPPVREAITRAEERPLIKLTNSDRLWVLGVGGVGISALGMFVSPVAWGLMPVMLCILGASYFART